MSAVASIRDAVAADADAIDGVVADGFASYRAWAPASFVVPGPDAARWPALSQGPAREDRAWVACDADGVVLGVARTATSSRAIAEAPPGAVILRNLFVARRAWGTGVADALLRHALQAARADGFEAIWLAHAAGSEQAARFYARHGFTERSRHHEPAAALDVVVCGRGL